MPFLFFLTLLAGCAGEDYTPIYFPPHAEEGEKGPVPSEAAGGRQCTPSFTSELCVTIKGDNLEVGTDPSEGLCTEVSPFPLHIKGTSVTIEGSEFPDIEVEGHGLPVPITINARGDGDGSANVGEGTIDAAGNMTIEGFSLFILALGIVGEVPDLTLTTGSTGELPHLPEATGSPPDVSGAMTLVAGTVMEHVIDAADEYLMGASLIVTFSGSISPTLAECGGETESVTEVTRLTIDENGKQTESNIPDGKRMEISAGTYIAEGPDDVGGRFEATAKFRVRNVSTRPQGYEIPSRKGPFYFDSDQPLSGTIKPQQSLVLNVTFRPTIADTEPGEITLPLPIGGNLFLLIGRALPQSGAASVSTVDDNGTVTARDVDKVHVGAASIPVGTQRKFFTCREIQCGDAKVFTSCSDCPDPTTTPCELLPVSASGRPLGEVDEQCRPAEPDAVPLFTIDLKGTTEAGLPAEKQVLAIRNDGVAGLKITGISIVEVDSSQSSGQFSIPEGAIFLSKGFEEIRPRVRRALEGNTSQGTKLPVTLPPFLPGFDETTLYVVVTYQPNDLVGTDGTQAGVGSKVRDKAILQITTDDGGKIETYVDGTTTILETPPLELYFRTSTGTKYIPDSMAFPFKGVTASTVDLAVPVFLRTADTADGTLRITSIGIEGDDAMSFRWLGTAEEIAAVQPPAGKGMRCSIFEVDEATGEVVSEQFDLKPVSLTPPGFDMAPGAHSLGTMPLFGCVDFHRDEGDTAAKRLYKADLVVRAQTLDKLGMPARNPDGSYRETTLTAGLHAAVNPRSGKLVMRIDQTMAAILNPKFPAFSAISSRSDMGEDIKSGRLKDTDLQAFTSALILDPFDEMKITSADGSHVYSGPNDGVTGIFRALDTHPVSNDYDDKFLFDYASLLHDSGLAEGGRGIFEDYPNKPEGMRANGWRIFTAALSYPGPLAPPERKPEYPSDCLIVNPCSKEGLKKFTDAGVAPGEKGACAYFYASGGRFDSAAFHTKNEMPEGEFTNLCNRVDEPQTLIDLDTGRYSVDGRIVFEELGLRFFGPTYFHNPGGPLGPTPPLDEVFHIAFTTGVLAPSSDPERPDVLPDERINLSKGEFKINLDDTSMDSPPICKNNTKNRLIRGKRYSSWKFLEGLLFKDEEATIPAGCPDEGNEYTGGTAYLRGRDLDHETGVVTFVAAGKFGSSDDLSFAFKDVMIFIVINGWLCDPMGAEEDFEGSRCYDTQFNDRDAVGQFSIMD